MRPTPEFRATELSSGGVGKDKIGNIKFTRVLVEVIGPPGEKTGPHCPTVAPCS